MSSTSQFSTNAVQLFRLWLGATEYLFRKPALLDEVLKTAIENTTFRSDDLEFTFAARVSRFHTYRRRTGPTSSYRLAGASFKASEDILGGFCNRLFSINFFVS